MLYALYNGEIISAEEIAEKESDETPVRRASGRKELRCIDPECECKTVFYRHGKVKRPHFSHAREGRCDYGDFDRTDNSELKEARIALYQHFKNLGYYVECEQKLPDSRLYSHLLLHIGGKNIVIQIAQSSTSANMIYYMTQACEKCGYELRWIVLGIYSEIQWERDNYHAMRYQYNHSTNRDLLVLDMSAEKISQHKIDENEYVYKSHDLGADDYFFMDKGIASLQIANNELTLDGFTEAYNEWVVQKQKDFEKMKQEIDALESRRKADSLLKPTTKHPAPLQPAAYHKGKPQAPRIIVTLEMVSQYQAGMIVKHKTRGNGVIISISQDPVSKQHNILIKFEYRERQFRLEELLENDMISSI